METGYPNVLMTLAYPYFRFITISFIFYLLGYFCFNPIFVLLLLFPYIYYKQRKIKNNSKAYNVSNFLEFGEEEISRTRHMKTDYQPNVNCLSSPIHSICDQTEWIDQIALIIWPYIGTVLDKYIRHKIEPLVRVLLEKFNVNRFKFRNFDVGTKAPKVLGIKILDMPSPDEIVIDVDFEYRGDLQIGVSVMMLSSSVSDIYFKGTLRIVLMPLLEDVPIIGGIQVSFLYPPDIGLNFGGAANIFDLPGLNDLVMDSIKDLIASIMVIPRKIVFRLSDKVSLVDLKMTKPIGVLAVVVVQARGLPKKDFISQIDPYVMVNLGTKRVKTTVKKDSPSPKWNEIMQFSVEVPQSQFLNICVLDRDYLSADDVIGRCKLSIDSLIQKGGHSATWHKLHQKNDENIGELFLRVYWLPTLAGETPESWLNRRNMWCAVAVLNVYLESCRLQEKFSEKIAFEIKTTENSDKHTISGISVEKVDGHQLSALFICQEGFTLLLNKLDVKTTLIFNIKTDNDDKEIATFQYRLSQMNNMRSALATYDIGAHHSKISFAANMQLLEDPIVSDFDEYIPNQLEAEPLLNIFYTNVVTDSFGRRINKIFSSKLSHERNDLEDQKTAGWKHVDEYLETDLDQQSTLSLSSSYETTKNDFGIKRRTYGGLQSSSEHTEPK